jgi:hypothetical protein
LEGKGKHNLNIHPHAREIKTDFGENAKPIGSTGFLSVLSSLGGKSLKKVGTPLKSGKCSCLAPSKGTEKPSKRAVFVSFLLDFAPIYRDRSFRKAIKRKQERMSKP